MSWNPNQLNTFGQTSQNDPNQSFNNAMNAMDNSVPSTYTPMTIAGDSSYPGLFGNDQKFSMPSWTSNSVSPDTPFMQTSFMKNLLGYKDPLTGESTPSLGQFGLNVGNGLFNAYMGMQKYNLAKDSFAENQRQFNLNLANQTKLTNSRLADRQAARVASNPNAYQSVGTYMNQYGV